MERLRARELYRDAGTLLIAIESVELRHEKTGALQHLVGRITPVAVLIRRADKTYALDMASQSVDVAQLQQQIPELTVMIGSMERG